MIQCDVLCSLSQDRMRTRSHDSMGGGHRTFQPLREQLEFRIGVAPAFSEAFPASRELAIRRVESPRPCEPDRVDQFHCPAFARKHGEVVHPRANSLPDRLEPCLGPLLSLFQLAKFHKDGSPADEPERVLVAHRPPIQEGPNGHMINPAQREQTFLISNPGNQTGMIRSQGIEKRSPKTELRVVLGLSTESQTGMGELDPEAAKYWLGRQPQRLIVEFRGRFRNLNQSGEGIYHAERSGNVTREVLPERDRQTSSLQFSSWSTDICTPRESIVRLPTR